MGKKIYLQSVIGYREDTLENWQKENPVLRQGEAAVVRDGENGRWLKIGDGKSEWNSLPYKMGPVGEKGEKGEKGTDGKDAVTDQTYSPTSENAQSGKAVAEALANVGGGAEEWELINELTLTEDAIVCITEDMDKTPISLKKFKVIVALPAVTSSTFVWLKINNSLAIQTQGSNATATLPSYSISGEYTFDWQFETCLSNVGMYANGQKYSTPYGHRLADLNISYPCKAIGLSLNAGFSQGLPSGTKIKIWGVKA